MLLISLISMNREQINEKIGYSLYIDLIYDLNEISPMFTNWALDTNIKAKVLFML